MIDYRYASLFNDDSVTKNLILHFSDDVEFSNNEIFEESLTLHESITSGEELNFGETVASTLEVSITNKTDSLKGETFTAILVLDNHTDYPFTIGMYKVVEDTLSADRTRRTLTCEDALADVINTDVVEWYNGLFENSTTISLGAMRSSLAAHFGLTEESATLCNDLMSVSKTVDASEMSGKAVLFAMCQINGCFPHITRDNHLRYIVLGVVNDNPYEIDTYRSCIYEGYKCNAITRLQIRSEENDIGVIVGDNDNNVYIVEDNFLLYGKGTEELTTIATNLYNVISIPWYKPCEIEVRANLCVEVGDAIELTATDGTVINSYLLERTASGIQAIFDTIRADGKEYRSEELNGYTSQIKALKGRYNVLERSIEETRSTIGHVEEGQTLVSMISQTAEGLTSEIINRQDADNSVRDTLTQTATSLSNQIEYLQREIDGETTLYHVNEAPTLYNYPAWDFCTNIPCNNTVQLGNGVPFIYTEADYQANIRALAYDDTNNISYRFKKTEGQWGWIAIGDSDYTYIMQRISELEQTDESISLRVTQIQGNTYTKTETESKIQVSANGILSTVSQSYQSKSAATTMQSQIDQQANQITAKVSKTGGTASSFAWSLTDSAFTLTSGNRQVFRCDANGITVNGYATANDLSALSLEVNGKATISDLSAATARISNLEVDHVSVANFNALSVTVNGKASISEVSADSIASKVASLGSLYCARFYCNSIEPQEYLRVPAGGEFYFGDVKVVVRSIGGQYVLALDY